MNGRFTGGTGATGHDRACELAATRVDETLQAGDLAWLEDHLAACSDCAAVAAEYEEQHLSLRANRVDLPEPPRDLWARTAAVMDAQGTRRTRRFGSRLPNVSALPVAGLMAVAIVVGVGLLNGGGFFPGGTIEPGSTIEADGPIPTPINVAATDVQVLTRGADGTVRVLTRRVDQVCPTGVVACGISSSFDVTTTASLSGSAYLDGIISPSKAHLVVMDRGDGVGGVYVVSMKTPDPSETPAPSGTPAPADTADPSVTPVPSDTPALTADPGTTDPPATATPDPSVAVPSTAPSRSPETTPPPTASPEETPAPTDEPTPSIAVSVTADGPLEIARDVIVVGGIAAYSPDESSFAFTARPADGSAGPDVYVWTVGDTQANAVTTDHASVLAGWLDGNLLVSRVADGKPGTVLLDLTDGSESAVGEGRVWRPAIGPDGRTAAWWDGSITLADDGVTPVPDEGRLVLGAWPDGTQDPQSLATGPLADWDVEWDAAGSALGVWTTTEKAGKAGTLSLYVVDPDTGRVDLDNPLVDATPAFGGFSLRPGRMAWSAPVEGGDTTVHVAVWSGRDMNLLELETDSGASVVR